MSTTPIRNLVLMIDTIAKRQDAIDAAEKRGDLSHHDWAPASRIWSRQHEALQCAIIAEPPQTFDDVLTVLSELAVRHDLITTQSDDTAASDLRDLHEMTTVAVKNCALRLASLYRPDAEPTEPQHEMLVLLSTQAKQWLPAAKGG